eukprot:TRINITY_DN5830_c0_g1_i4.p3 TRINITY_DN5830_c0_g1~~TRINITY_DN5830_c0_g1_i4.p3  ORF type:complete len:203 (+),score=43.63 TRINITY_DN5830_c0_g1_i4:663-1271(+)
MQRQDSVGSRACPRSVPMPIRSSALSALKDTPSPPTSAQARELSVQSVRGVSRNVLSTLSSIEVFSQSLRIGKLLNEVYEDTMQFECENSHIWKVKYSKYLFSKWCSHCSRLQKRECKKQRQEELRRQKEQFAQDQNEMLEKARREMLQGPADSLCSIDAKANQMAADFLAGRLGESDAQDIVTLYKVMLTPDEMLAKQMYS